jgi:hypothetical protein
MRRALLCLAMLVTAAASAAEDPALVVLEACRAKLDARNDVGLARIEKRCPDLMPALQRAPWSNLLPKDMRERRDEISAEGLRELARLVRDLEPVQARRPAPDVKRLAPVLTSLGEKGQQGATRWERFKRWLQDKFERSDDEKDEKSWVEEWGRQFETSEGVARVITYAGYALLAMLVLLVIWSELRAAGLLGGGGRADARRGADGEWRRRLQLTDIMAAPLAERPGLLLRLLGEALTRAQRLPSAAGLTAGALVKRARLDSEEDRAGLEQVASAAEAVRYAPSPPASGRLEDAVTTAQALLDKLASARGASRGGR